jgi:hypothetical protein
MMKMTTSQDFQHEEINEEIDQVEEGDIDRDMIHTPFDPANVDIFDKKFTIGSLLERLKHDELLLTPDFQRRANLWDTERKSRLIESILLRIPLPSFYFSEDENGNFEVVDGLQRLCAIFHFIDHAALNRATRSKLVPLRLKGLQYLEKEDEAFSELDRPFQRRINELEVNVNVIRATTPKAVMFNVFARLNQGGLPLSAQEIRNAIYPGAWRDHVRQLADSQEFANATDGKVPKDRQQDMEMVLRFIALWSLESPYERTGDQGLDGFLNETVEQRLPKWNGRRWESCQEAFFKGIKAAVDVFGRHAFRKSFGDVARAPINRGLFESQVVTLSALPNADIKTLAKRQKNVYQEFKALLNGPGRFSSGLRSGTGHAEASNARVTELTRLYQRVLDA